MTFEVPPLDKLKFTINTNIKIHQIFKAPSENASLQWRNKIAPAYIEIIYFFTGVKINGLGVFFFFW